MELTEKQKRFVDYFIELGNATQAAIKANYPQKTAANAGSKLLKNKKVALELKKKMELLESERIADANEVLKYLTSVMRGEVCEETVVVEAKGDFESKARVVKKQVTPKDRNKAAELLAKRHGLLSDRLELTVTEIGWYKEDDEK
ncbi:MAG: phage terminase small subunit [Fusobacteria bacterium]|nr:MAG: phage terminase small subunit [Fusobacteriota bacterium]KAF0228966.1 MAG: phage terminase small [Fusobacteriota bacterium]